METKKTFRGKLLMLFAVLMIIFSACEKQKYVFESVENDALNTKMYTLDNGLKVYMTVNKELPRIQTYIAVHVGSKFEPSETTGLAHYLERMMFKGSSHFGTMNFDEEKILLDQIRDLYEVYRKTTDETERAAIYHQIDSISYQASGYFIPNEYDKLMAHLGAAGTNAFTSYDQTVYQEDIPSNQIENWAKIQSDRFKNMVLRGFHTELEAVYEEYNMYLNSDWDRISNAVFETLTPTHPYRHSVIGLGEHLKNPSIRNIEDFFHTYYVPNNMAICLSGDFDPDEMLSVIEKYFGDMQANENLQMPKYEAQPELTASVDTVVTTPNPEQLVLAWRLDGVKSMQTDTLTLLANVLHNGTAGLMDIDLNLTQKVNESYAFPYSLCDYSALLLLAVPQAGQTLEELRGLMLTEMNKLRNGEFSDELVQSVITELKLQEQHKLEDNNNRAMEYVEAFTNDVPWDEKTHQFERISKLTKQDVVDFANRHLTDNNYVAVFKKQGELTDAQPVPKPAITPIKMNRDSLSTFANDVMTSEVKPIEPVFLDFKKDLSLSMAGQNKIPVTYCQNKLNDLFELDFVFDMGLFADKELGLVGRYLQFLGTDSLSADEIARLFYLYGCEFNVSADNRRTYVSLSGLNDNLPKALTLLEKLMANAQTNQDSYKLLSSTILQERQNVLDSFDSYKSFLRDFLMYGEEGVKATTLSNEEMLSVDPQSLVDKLHGLFAHEHSIFYYGPSKMEDVVALINDVHTSEDALLPCAQNVVMPQLLPEENECFVLPYKGTTSFVMCQYSGIDNSWNLDKQGLVRMYNEYFGGGMNTVVFQEMREKRSLCYGASAMYRVPKKIDEHESFTTYIQSQNDKLCDCINVFDDIVNNMPMSETAFDVCKQGLITQLRTDRIIRDDILTAYLNAKDFGLDFDPRMKIYEQVNNLTLNDVLEFQKSHVKGLKYRSGFAGDPSGLDQQELEKLGAVHTLTPADVFGY